MFTHSKPPTTQPFEVGYVCYMRLLTISNMVMASLWADQGVRTGMHVRYDDQGATVVNLYLLGLTPKDQRVSAMLDMALVSSLSEELLFIKKVRDEQQTTHSFRFSGTPGQDPEDIDMRIATDIAAQAVVSLKGLYADPELDSPVDPVIQTAKDGSFMKKVVSKRDIGQSTNYEVKFTDGTLVRCTMPTQKGEKIRPGDWLYGSPAGGIERIPAEHVN